MPSHKNQHFTPRCLLKPFSLGGEGKAINLYTSLKDKLIRQAPLKNQCSRDYFYGSDGGLETSLAFTEARFTEARDRVVNGRETPDDLDLLRFFAYLQLRRTEMAVMRLAAHQQDMFREVFGDDEPAHPPTSYFMKHSLQLCIDTQAYLMDLKTRIVVNETDQAFVIADDPAVFINKYALQKHSETNYGVHSSGLVMTMPLTPRLALLCYDSLVYTVPSIIGRRIPLTKRSDVDAMNELQYLNAGANIYFSSWDNGPFVRDQFKAFEALRPKEFAIFTHAVHVGTDASGRQTFKEASKEEAAASGRSLIHTQVVNIAPSSWLSHLKYRNPIKTFHARNAAGHVRKKEWLEGPPSSSFSF